MLYSKLMRAGITSTRLPAFWAAKTTTRTSRPLVATQQSRRVGTILGRDPKEDMGGPGGQEALPMSNGIRRHFAIVTAAGVATACAVMYIAKLMEWNADPEAVYVLVHDNSKGELADVFQMKKQDIQQPL
ncbi:hypothetical protein B0H63DRAFT_518183 [Podospora didyma]|uniref:Uncharacterized protein n=1 Tax=Podospora didyma TaxID=330526 RepID=A0AAE0P874_9PEZI|nr:hypothetical protein B0H63DRAFT_518183 [Podospora didyma]